MMNKMRTRNYPLAAIIDYLSEDNIQQIGLFWVSWGFEHRDQSWILETLDKIALGCEFHALKLGCSNGKFMHL